MTRWNRKNSLPALAAAVCLGLAHSPAEGVLIIKDYAGFGDSTWNVNENWAPFGVPDNSGPFEYHPIIDGGVIVSVDLSVVVTNLSLLNQSEVWVASGRTLALYGATMEMGGSNVFNEGRIRIYAEGSNTRIGIHGGLVNFWGVEDAEVLMEAGTGAGFSEIYGTGTAITSWLANRAGHTIRGAGFFQNSLNVINEGLIMADNPSKALEIRVPDFLSGGTFANDGTLRADNGATLKLLRTGTTTTARYVHEFGVVEALDGSTVEIDGRTIQHYGYFRTEGSGVIRVLDDFCSVRGPFTIDGEMRVANNKTLDIDGTIVLSPSTGELWIDSVSPFFGGLRLTSLGDATLSGGGVVDLGDSANNFIVSSAAGRRLTNAGCTIRGGGRLGDNGLSITNQGVIEADAASAALRIDPPSTGDFTNDAGGWLIASTSPGIIIDAGPFTNEGLVRVLAGSSLTRTGTYQQNGGTTEVHGSLTVTGGSLELAGGSLYATGPITAAVSNSGGNVNPGDIGQSPDILAITGSYSQGAAGQLVIQLGGLLAESEHDQLWASGDITLDGELLVTTIDGFVPEASDSFLIVQSGLGTVSGTFATVNGDWDVVYTSNSVIISPGGAQPCAADLVPPGGDGAVTIADVVSVIAAYGLPCDDCPQDIMPQPDGDNAVTIADVTAVMTTYGPCE